MYVIPGHKKLFIKRSNEIFEYHIYLIAFIKIGNAKLFNRTIQRIRIKEWIKRNTKESLMHADKIAFFDD